MFGFKFLERVGLVDHSALVIVGHKTAKVPKQDDVDERFSSAFSFDLENGAITKIEHAEWMWHWKFKQLAHFEKPGSPDVAFTYLSCWECEPVELLSTLRYDAPSRKWAMREWEADKMIWWTGQEGLVVDADILEGADETLSFSCLHDVLDLRGTHVDSVANRCREVTEITGGQKIATDVTVVYALDGGLLKVRPVTSTQEVAAVTAQLCVHKPSHGLCKLPPASTYNSTQLTMLGMFPGAPKTRRDMDCFQAFHAGISVYSIVDKCGRPDTGGGTSVGFFEYRLDDGSMITIHWTDMQHILDMVHSDKFGKTKTLWASK